MIRSLPKPYRMAAGCLLVLMVLFGSALCALAQEAEKDLAFFAGMKDRSTGSQGSEEAADYIVKAFEQAGLSQVGVQKFLTPVPRADSASIEVGGSRWDIYPWGPNLAALPKTPKEGLSGPLLYAANGEL